MKTSLIITTYNWKEALDAVLKSIINQSKLPDEVIIADDGSTQDTADLIKQWQETFPTPLIHSWQEDTGFRLAESRNRAIARASGDYIIMIDGDMVLSKDFISCYTNSAKKGWFIQGGRVTTNVSCSKIILTTSKLPTLFSKGIKNRKNVISCRLLSALFSFERGNDKATRGCNMGFWYNDLLEVNGFNNDFVGWGREDSEFTIRMLNAGKRRLYLKFAAVAFHLFHNEKSRTSLEENDKLLLKAVNDKLTWCENGLNKFIN